tara:strand:+ start:747 stop:1316 length:570 start_codon:yes stop_codon:yes gene_type:complete
MITETSLKYFLKKNNIAYPPMGRNDDDWISASFQEGGTNYNEQVGLVNANAQANLNVTIFDSGAVAGAGTAAGTAIAGTGAATGVAAAIPVVGIVIAAVSATIGIVQMFETRNRQLAFQRATDSLKVEMQELQEQTQLITLEAQLAYEALNLRIELRQKALRQNQILLIGGISVIVLAGFIFVYKLRKR